MQVQSSSYRSEAVIGWKGHWEVFSVRAWLKISIILSYSSRNPVMILFGKVCFKVWERSGYHWLSSSFQTAKPINLQTSPAWNRKFKLKEGHARGDDEVHGSLWFNKAGEDRANNFWTARGLGAQTRQVCGGQDRTPCYKSQHRCTTSREPQLFVLGTCWGLDWVTLPTDPHNPSSIRFVCACGVLWVIVAYCGCLFTSRLTIERLPWGTAPGLDTIRHPAKCCRSNPIKHILPTSIDQTISNEWFTMVITLTYESSLTFA